MSLNPRSMLRRTAATVTAAALALSPLPMQAGDLNAEVNSMFDSLGAIGNYTQPGAFRGQTFNALRLQARPWVPSGSTLAPHEH